MEDIFDEERLYRIALENHRAAGKVDHKRFCGKPEDMDEITLDTLKNLYPGAFQNDYVIGDLVTRHDGQPFIVLSCIGANKNAITNNFTGTAVFVEKTSVCQFVDGFWEKIKP